MKRLEELKRNAVLVVSIMLLSTLSTIAQNKEMVKVVGVVYNDDHIRSVLSDVAVFNKNQKKGAISNEKGEFIIEMKQNDTLIFSTVQHMDEEFFFGTNDPFEDQVLEIQLKTDTIWLKMISVMGNGNYQKFKRELLALDMPEDDHSLALPVVNKYAEEYSTGVAAIKIHGPLTYLSHKISIWKKRGKSTPVE
ncbi:MAG: hypothetical protein K9G46_15725 [Flavobacteriales bacterium]|jgi:hypothetical protein|nr:hypothetical protein [Flavobacteriales bacterium]